MNSIDQLALLSGIDEDLILDAIPDAWVGGAAPMSARKKVARAYDRFMSSGWVAAILSVVVALGVLTGIVYFMRQGPMDQPPTGGPVETDGASDDFSSETVSIPDSETATPIVPEAEWLWIIKDGASEFVLEMPGADATDTLRGAATTLRRLIREQTSVQLSLADASAPTEYSHCLRVAADESLGMYGYRVEVTDTDVILSASAESYEAFTYAINRLLKDGAVGQGLRLPRDYRVEVIEYESNPIEEPETETDPPPAAEIPTDAIRTLTDQLLYEQYPHLVGIGLDSFNCRVDRNRINSKVYHIQYSYKLCGMHTHESYSIRLNVVEGGFALIDTYSSNEGEYSQYHTMCTPDKLKKAQAELAELSGDDYSYLEVNDKGQLLLSTEVIVSLTPPPGTTDSGCGIDHEHKFYSVVVCP